MLNMFGSFVSFSIVAPFIIAMSIEAQNSTGCCEDYCYARDTERPQLLHFSTKTAYGLMNRGQDSISQYVVPSKCGLTII